MIDRQFIDRYDLSGLQDLDLNIDLQIRAADAKPVGHIMYNQLNMFMEYLDIEPCLYSSHAWLSSIILINRHL
jgi:hypothetical protein